MPISVFSATDGSYATLSLNGSEKLRLNVDGSATVGGTPVQRYLNLGTKATTSGTSVDFSPADGTGIPSWGSKITISLDGVSTSGTGVLCFRLGTSAGVVTTGYTSTGAGFSTGGGVIANAFTDYVAWADGGGAASNTNTGILVLTKHTGNTWVVSGSGIKGGGVGSSCSGRISLPGVLDRVRITNGGGDTFDAGSVSVIVEG